MKNKKGFTLIELLAVIVILAIIAVIATPIILNIIEESREGAAEASAYNSISAVQNYYAQSQLDATPQVLPLTVDFSAKPSDLIISGTVPTDGTVVLAADGTVTVTDLIIGSYSCDGTGTTMACTK